MKSWLGCVDAGSCLLLGLICPMMVTILQTHVQQSYATAPVGICAEAPSWLAAAIFVVLCPFEYVHIFAVYGIAVHSCMVTLSCAADVLSMECMLP